MSKAKNDIPPDKLELYDRAVAAHPEMQRKGAANPYTSLNGHMFSYMNAVGSLALRLPKGEREAFLTRYDTKLFEAYGIVMKEYVTVPDHVLADTEALAKYLRISYDYIATLKPKPTTKKKKD